MQKNLLPIRVDWKFDEWREFRLRSNEGRTKAGTIRYDRALKLFIASDADGWPLAEGSSWDSALDDAAAEFEAECAADPRWREFGGRIYDAAAFPSLTVATIKGGALFDSWRDLARATA